MMTWHEFVKDYLTFSRRERIGVITLIALIFLVILLPGIISKTSTPKQVLFDTSWMSKVKKLETKKSNNDAPDYQTNNQEENISAYQFDQTKGSYGSFPKRELFYFDPNTLSINGWQKLGLRNKTINTIQNFLKKGGSFKRPEDLQKIYGLKNEEYEMVNPFVRIEVSSKKIDALNPAQAIENTPPKNFTPRYSIIDINSADTTAYISLPGIGSKLAARIINFRNMLGGFYSINQIAETYGLPDSTFQKIKQYLKLENSSVKKININTATVEELKSHPYIKYSLANPIVAYRNEHGPFSKVDDIKKVMVMTEEVYIKIVSYLSTQ